jgi:two-component system, cell cycle response regulator
VARKHNRTSKNGRLVLIIDDNEEYLRSTEDLLRRAGHTVLTAADPEDGLRLAQTQPVELVLVDYHMPGMNGEDFVVELRKWNPLVQVVLQTGYARELPPREMLRRMDIQGYYDKSEGPEKLLFWTDVGLKSASMVRALEASRRGMRHVLGATPELHRPQPVDHLLAAVLRQSVGLLDAVDSFVAVPGATEPTPPHSAFVAVIREDDEFVMHLGTGRFVESCAERSLVGPQLGAAIARAFEGRCATVIDGAIVLPLAVGYTTIGAIYIDAPARMPDLELFQILANQASVAIYNAHLHEMAAIDKLTGACTRRFADQSLMREVRAAHRFQMPLSVLMVDIDRMRSVNDGGGHVVGDATLAEVAMLLRKSTRPIDVVGRHGGDEFIVILTGTDDEGARVIGDRILAGVDGLQVCSGDATMSVGVSLGIATLHAPGDNGGLAALDNDAFDMMGIELVEQAQRSLEAAKLAGGSVAGEPGQLWWAANRRPASRTGS